jgi:hypothetical protein
MTPEEALTHLIQLALEAPAPAKFHNKSKEAFEVLKKLIEEKNTVKEQESKLS